MKALAAIVLALGFTIGTAEAGHYSYGHGHGHHAYGHIHSYGHHHHHGHHHHVYKHVPTHVYTPTYSYQPAYPVYAPTYSYGHPVVIVKKHVAPVVIVKPQHELKSGEAVVEQGPAGAPIEPTGPAGPAPEVAPQQ